MGNFFLIFFLLMNNITIAIDGPSASGKSTTAKLLAEKLNYIYIDTGAMYRAVTLAWIREKTDISDDILLNIMKNINVSIKQSEIGQRTFLNGEDVSDEIRLPDVTKFVSPISAIACVREILVSQQRKLAAYGAAVMDGRDIGTVVLPNAELKIYLVASIDARSKRRALELKLKGVTCNEEDIKQQLIDRDKFDSSREISPLQKAKDAIEIDTSLITIDEQVNKILELVYQKTL